MKDRLSSVFTPPGEKYGFTMHDKPPGRRDFLRTLVHLMLLGAGWSCVPQGGGKKSSGQTDGKETPMKLSLSAPGRGELFQQGRDLAQPGGTHRPGPQPRVPGPLHAGLPGGHSFAARKSEPDEPADRGGRPQGLHGHRRLCRAPQRRAGSRRPAQHRTLPGPGGVLWGRPDPDLHEEGGGYSLGAKGLGQRGRAGHPPGPPVPLRPACSRRWRAPSRCWRRWTGPTSGSSTNPPTG